MKSIYDLGNTVFRAETKEGRLVQEGILKRAIEKALSDDNDIAIYNAMAEAEQEGKTQMYQLIEDNMRNIVNSTILTDYINEFRSDMFILPVGTINDFNSTRFPSLQFMEQTISELFLKYNLMPPKAKVVLSPILLGQETSKEMTMSKWYDLHQKTLRHSPNRTARKIFTNDYSINTDPNVPFVNFIVGVIIQANNDRSSIQPRLFSEDYYVLQDKRDFTNELSAMVKSRASRSDWGILTPNFIGTALLDGYHYYQKILIKTFISSYKDTPNISFVLLSLDTHEHFVVFIWDESTNKIINYLYVQPYGVDMQDNVEIVMDSISETNKIAYVGNTIVSTNIVNVYENFNFQEYLAENGASILHAEEEPEF